MQRTVLSSSSGGADVMKPANKIKQNPQIKELILPFQDEDSKSHKVPGVWLEDDPRQGVPDVMKLLKFQREEQD